MNMKQLTRYLAPLTLALVAASVIAPPSAATDHLTWMVKSNYRHGVQVSFYSQTRSFEWPGAGRAFRLADRSTHTYDLTCITGEKICFGAWAPGDSRIYWGVGADREHGCDQCCYVCGGGETARQILD